MKNIFEASVHNEVKQRIEALTPNSQAQWGKMNVAQMLAHCCVTYEMIFDDKHKAPGGFAKLLLKLFVKPIVVSEKPYKRNSQTAPQFIVAAPKVFENEKARLLAYMDIVQGMGAKEFEGKSSLSFGKLTAKEWNNMFYKHLDHHLTQFGA